MSIVILPSVTRVVVRREPSARNGSRPKWFGSPLATSETLNDDPAFRRMP